MEDILKARMLLRVSSRQQLDANGDLTVQRRVVENYIKNQEYWQLDSIKPEYHELGVSGYKNTVAGRKVLQEILADAKKQEFNILVCYKDDRLGRREDEIPAYIKELAACGVLVYTVKEGCITPKNHTDSLMMFIRYWSAQGDSMKTAQRVKDMATEHTRMGRNQGGKAPFGYRLELSGELSRHQRVLKRKVIVPEEANIVKKVYNYYLVYGYGAYKIARILNSEPGYCSMAPNGTWRAGTISDMLKNPVYTGYEAYNRRTREAGICHRQDRKDWILAEKCNEDIKIIDMEMWEKVQKQREARRAVYQGNPGNNSTHIVYSMVLAGVAYCGCCGRKLVNGSKYNYWTAKDGTRKSSITRYYRCQTKKQGGNCKGKGRFLADSIEQQVYSFVKSYLRKIEDNTYIFKMLEAEKEVLKDSSIKKIKTLQRQQKEYMESIITYETNLPKVLRGEIPVPVKEYCSLLEKEKEKYTETSARIKELQDTPEEAICIKESSPLPSWEEIFNSAEVSVKQAIINKIASRIDIWEDKIIISARINAWDN